MPTSNPLATVAGREAAARLFVNHQIANTISEDSLPVLLDMMLSLRVLRDQYMAYQLLLGTATIDLAQLGQVLPTEAVAGLSLNQRRHLEACCQREANSINEATVRGLGWVNRQLAGLGEREAQLQPLLDARIDEYAA